jgi:hydroxyquinol 1,2-dioxygenase
MKLTPEQITQQALKHGDGGKSHPRLYEIYTSLIKHLHAFVREVDLTEAELIIGRDFLTRAAQPSDEMARGEIELLTDLLGLSELVVVLHDNQQGHGTESNIEGPLYVEGAPERKMGAPLGVDPEGEPLLLSGQVLHSNGMPIAGALIDVWQADSKGQYDNEDPHAAGGNFRGRYRTGADGRYAIATVVPQGYKVPESGPCGNVLRLLGRHAWRAAHIHFKLSAPGCLPLTTQLFVEGAPYLDSDTTFAVKNALITLQPDPGVDQAGDGQSERRSYLSEFNFVLNSASRDQGA